MAFGQRVCVCYIINSKLLIQDVGKALFDLKIHSARVFFKFNPRASKVDVLAERGVI